MSFSTSSTPQMSNSFRPKVLRTFLKIFRHFFGSFQDFFAPVDDPRYTEKTTYSLPSLLFTGIWLFLCRLGAVRQIKFQLHSEAAAKTFATLFGVDTIPHGDTLKNTFPLLDPCQVGSLIPKAVRVLLRKRVLEYARFKGCYLIAIDGTGVYVFAERHCEHCLSKEHNGKTLYYHMVLEAKLVTSDGFAFSVMSEFIENPGEKPAKQDCETKAFHRLAERLKQAFPRLPMLLLLDGMFAEGPVFQRCLDYGWEFLIVLRNGDLPSVNQEFRNLQPLNPACRKIVREGGLVLSHTWINGISYRDTQKRDFSLNVLELRERNGEEGTTYRWISSLAISDQDAGGLARIGRKRWIIENQGFNTQKNLGFALEHPYSKDPVGMKVFYYLLQIAHLWTQLCERSSILRRAVPKGFGALKNVAMRLLEDWRVSSILREEWEALVAERVRIQFDTS